MFLSDKQTREQSWPFRKNLKQNRNRLEKTWNNNFDYHLQLR